MCRTLASRREVCRKDGRGTSQDGHGRHLVGVYNRTTDLGASEHPNRYGQEKMAKVVIEKFAELTGWE